MLDLIFAILLGILAGTFTGLTPGIHINLVSAALLSLPAITSKNPLAAIIFIVAMSTAHTLIDFIPSIYLGAPDDSTAMGVLPGHRFLLDGKADHAVNLTVIGAFLGILILIIILIPFNFLVPKIYPFLTEIMALILIAISIFIISQEKEKIIQATIIFLLAGFLGLSTLNLKLNQPLLPLLSGLFGTSIILTSIKNKTKIPKQETEKIKIPKRNLIKPAISTMLISPFCSFLPGLGSNQAAVIGSRVFKKTSPEQFLILIGSINTIVMALSFVTLYLINKSRTGSALAVSKIQAIDSQTLKIILAVIIISCILAAFVTKILSKAFAKNLNKINYTKISWAVLIFITFLVTIISGFVGLLVLIVSTTIGLFSTEINVSKSLLMGSLIIPTIIFYI